MHCYMRAQTDAYAKHYAGAFSKYWISNATNTLKLGFQITHKLMTKSRHNHDILTKSKILGNAASPMQIELCLQVFSLPFTLHRRCNISYTVCLSDTAVNWSWTCDHIRHLGCCHRVVFHFSGSSARLHSLCTLFQCVLRRSGIVLRFWHARKYWNFERGLFRHQWWRFAFTFRNIVLEYWWLGLVSISFKSTIWWLNPGSQCLNSSLLKRSVW